MYENVGELKVEFLGNKRFEELAKVERNILELEQILEAAPEKETADLAVLEYWRVRATQIRDKESIEKGAKKVNSAECDILEPVVDRALHVLMKNHPMGRVLIKAFELCLKKNKDYATQEDIFANFRESEDMGTPPSKGVAHRLSDKWMRFKKGVRNNWVMEVKGEGMADTILDIINYASIYYCLYLEESRDRMAEPTPSPKQKPGAY